MTSRPVTADGFVESVEDTLRTFVNSRRELVQGVSPVYSDAVDELVSFVLRGGKRVRPAFAWTGWVGAGGDPSSAGAPAVLAVCSALELVQACALIHDDIIDSSLTRRGFPTVHVTFAERHRAQGWSGDPDRYGESVGVLLGDLALCWADDMVRFADLDADAAGRVAPVWSAMRTEVMGGQLLDITVEASGDESVEAALRIDRYKTAAYTVERPLLIGAALADADPALIAAYHRFGADIGVAFQLRDDLLGVFGDPEITGKPSGDDLREGKRTVLLAVALAAADRVAPDSAAMIRSKIGTDLSDDEVDTLRSALIDLGAVDDVESRISALTDSALAELDLSDATAPAKERLRSMAWSATRREY
ncbi:polyprenyl synthetase family protein [Rhodococcoides trifolii]|uniref:polyprenyl synthetase family protein n=1 Tax=Rhodococcoides trifolii TaxID=908250 RepID=UPI001E2A498E|nr:polyprenyl synthetase family protein [Rhodococcus trifolii]